MQQMTAEQGPQVRTVMEAASQLKLGYRGCLAAIKRGQLGAVRVGKEYRVPQQSIDALLASGNAPTGRDA